MSEKSFYLEGVDPQEFYGASNTKLNMLSTFFPKLKIVARGDFIKVMGDQDETVRFQKSLKQIIAHYHQFNVIPPKTIAEIVNGQDVNELESIPDILVFGNNGKPIVAKTPNQRLLVEKGTQNDLLFAIGPAGSGKTYTAIAMAVKALKERQIKKIILSRPAVEAGERLGFLPGDLKEKIDPYLQPLYDALGDMIPARRLEELLKENTIEIAPLAFMRGRTLSNAFVILDEAQNTTEAQLKMFLTRMGKNTKYIITGDETQIDLPRRNDSGLLKAMRILRKIPGIAFVTFDKSDIVRHKLVQRIVEAYENHEKTTHNNIDKSEKK